MEYRAKIIDADNIFREEFIKTENTIVTGSGLIISILKNNTFLSTYKYFDIKTPTYFFPHVINNRLLLELIDLKNYNNYYKCKFKPVIFHEKYVKDTSKIFTGLNMSIDDRLYELPPKIRNDNVHKHREICTDKGYEFEILTGNNWDDITIISKTVDKNICVKYLGDSHNNPIR